MDPQAPMRGQGQGARPRASTDGWAKRARSGSPTESSSSKRQREQAMPSGNRDGDEDVPAEALANWAFMKGQLPPGVEMMPWEKHNASAKHMFLHGRIKRLANVKAGRWWVTDRKADAPPCKYAALLLYLCGEVATEPCPQKCHNPKSVGVMGEECVVASSPELELVASAIHGACANCYAQKAGSKCGHSTRRTESVSAVDDPTLIESDDSSYVKLPDSSRRAQHISSTQPAAKASAIPNPNASPHVSAKGSTRVTALLATVDKMADAYAGMTRVQHAIEKEVREEMQGLRKQIERLAEGDQE